jgi:hypothetical protein
MCVKLTLKANIKGHFFPKGEASRASKLLELVHSDVCGPMKTTSRGGEFVSKKFNDFLHECGLNVKQMHLTHHNKMELWNEPIGPSWNALEA